MDANRLEHNLIIYARAIYANYTLTMVGAGVHIVMALYGLSVFLETPEHLRKGRRRYIAASLIITVLAVLSASLDIATYFEVLFRSTSGRQWMRIMQEYQQGPIRVLSTVTMGCLLLVADGLLVYRCYMICIEYWWVVILPAAASLAGIVLFFVGNLFVLLDRSDPVTRSRISSASTFLTVITNIVLTSLIAFRLLWARRTISKILPSSDLRLYTTIVAVLIESALPLSVFGIIAAAIQHNSENIASLPAPFWVCDALFIGLFYIFCSISPHMIIFRVTTGRSFTKFPSIRDGAQTNELQFAHKTAESSFLQPTFKSEFGRSSDPDTEQGLNTRVGVPSQTSIIDIGREKRGSSEDLEKVR